MGPSKGGNGKVGRAVRLLKRETTGQREGRATGRAASDGTVCARRSDSGWERT